MRPLARRFRLWLLFVVWGVLLAGCQPGAIGAGAATAAARNAAWLERPETEAQPVTAVTLAKWGEGLRLPTYLTHAGDERLFVVEQHGRIQVLEDGRLRGQPFLDVSGQISIDGSERGLLGLAFHPDYQENGRFFIVYTNPAGDTELREYRVSPNNPNRADAESGRLLLYLEQPYGNHNGGQLLFGPDGYLYTGFGDGGAVGDPYDNAQDPGTLLGAILRLDVDGDTPYVIPADNPFVGQEGARGEVWAIGLRNPWAFSFDRLTGDLYLTDVGQEGPEELNFLAAGVPGGANFGWPYREGNECYESDTCRSKGLVPPVFTYTHEEGCAIIGGHVYRGRSFPELAGNYFFSDHCSGVIWVLRFVDGRPERRVVYETGTPVSAIGEDVNGELYVVTYRGGEVFQIQAGAGDEAAD